MKIRRMLIIPALAVFCGCKPVAYMNTPNDVHQRRGTLYMQNGSQEDGLISIDFETGQAAKNYVELTRNAETKKIVLRDIRGYRVDTTFYALKELDLDFSGVTHLLFVRQITRDSSRIGFYELYQQKTTGAWEGIYSYFISLPSHGTYGTWNIAGRDLEPDFNVKMSRVVGDCPALAGKILDKTKGYFLPAYTRSDAKKVHVLKNIIDEYNACR
jgi:hypothetical protein